MKLEWSDEASSDVDCIVEYIALDNVLAALDLDEVISDKAAQLLEQPKMGRAGRASGTRELVVHPNYILVYRITGDTVLIIRVLHAAQQWP